MPPTTLNPFVIPNMVGPGTFAAPGPRLNNPFALFTPPPRPVQADVQRASPRRAAPLPRLTEEEESSLLGSALGGLEYIGGAIDKPFAAMRGLVSGLTGGPWGGPWDSPLGSLANAIPFSDTLGITDREDVVFGRDILRNAGLIGQTNTWGNFFGGLALDLLIAPPLPAGPVAAAFPKLLLMSRGLGAAGKSARLGSRLTRITGIGADARAQLGALRAVVVKDTLGAAKFNRQAVETLSGLGGYIPGQSLGQMVQEIRLGQRGIAALRMPWIPIPGFGAKGLGLSSKTLLRGNLGFSPETAARIAGAGLYGRFSPIRYTRPLFSTAVEGTHGRGGRAGGLFQEARELQHVANEMAQGVVNDTMGAFRGEIAELEKMIAPIAEHASIAGNEVGATSAKQLTQQLAEMKTTIKGVERVMADDLFKAIQQTDDLTPQALRLTKLYEQIAPHMKLKPATAPELAPRTLANVVERLAAQSPDDASRLTLTKEEILTHLEISNPATLTMNGVTIKSEADEFAELIATAFRDNVRKQRAVEFMDHMGLNANVLSTTNLGIAQEFSHDFAAILDEQFRVLMDTSYKNFNSLGGRGKWLKSNFLAHSPNRPSDPQAAKAWDEVDRRLNTTTPFAKQRLAGTDIPERARVMNSGSMDPDLVAPFANRDKASLFAKANGIPEDQIDDMMRTESQQRANMADWLDSDESLMKLPDEWRSAEEGVKLSSKAPTAKVRKLYFAEKYLRPAHVRSRKILQDRDLVANPLRRSIPEEAVILDEMQQLGLQQPGDVRLRKILQGRDLVKNPLNRSIPEEARMLNEMQKLGLQHPGDLVVPDGGIANKVVDEEAFHWFDAVRESQAGKGVFKLADVDDELTASGLFDLESARPAMDDAVAAGLAEKTDAGLRITQKGWAAKQTGQWLMPDADAKSSADLLSRYLGKLPLKADGIYNQTLMTDIGDYMHSVEAANSNLHTIHNFMGGMIRMGRETPGSDMITLKQAWRSSKMKGSQFPQLSDEGLVTLVRNNGDEAFQARVKAIEKNVADPWTQKKEIRKAATEEADKILVSEQSVKAIDTYTKMMDPRSTESTVIGRVYDQWTALFKGFSTTPFPAFHTRNFISGVYMNMSAEAPWTIRDLWAGYREMHRWAKSQGKESPQFLDEVWNNTLLGKGLLADISGEAATGVQVRGSEMSFRHIFAPFIDAIRKGGGERISRNPLRLRGVFGDISEGTGKQFFAAEAGERAYKAVEAWNRIPPYLAARRAGLTESQAIHWVNKVQYDYSKLTQFERTVMRRIVPFYGWLRNNMPYQVANITNFPGGKNATAVRMALSTQRSIEGYTPKWLREQMAFPVPGGEGDEQTFVRQFGLPFEDLQNLSTDPRRSMERAIANAHPVISALYSTISDRNPYTGQNLGDVQPKAPYNTGEPAFDMLLQRLNPFARSISEAKKAVRVGQELVAPGDGGRVRGAGLAAADLFTGLKLPQYDAERARLLDLSNALRARAEESPYVRTFETPYIPKDLREEAPPEDLYTLRQLQGLQRELAELRASREPRE